MVITSYDISPKKHGTTQSKISRIQDLTYTVYGALN